VLALLVLLLIAGGAAAYLLTRPTKSTVPNVVTESLSVAQARVQGAGFNVIYQSVPDSHKSGTVIHQFPLGGDRLNTGSTVTLTVSTGPGNISVPSVSGLTEAAARRRLRNAGLKVDGVQKQNSATVASGRVIGSDPSSGQSVASGAFVTLLVSSGQAQVNVPNVTGDAEAAARNTLTNAGFTVTSSSQQSSAVAAGNVIAQNPAPGTKAAPGSAVDIVIATAPTTAKVPSVIGDTAAAAQSTLQSAGFKVTKQTRVTTKQNQDGNVVDQSPKSGNLQKGSTVTIIVGVYQPANTTTTPTTTTPTTTKPTTTPTTSTTTTPGG
jgi:serine/threonine-protein kinase